MTVVAVVTDEINTLAAARAALDEALATGTDLAVVGVVTPRFHAPQPATGQRERQNRLVTAVVGSVLAVADARAVDAQGTIISGTPLGAGLREAHARGASAVHVPPTRSRLRRGRTNASAERIQLAGERQEATDMLAA